MTNSTNWLERYRHSVMNTFGTPQQVLVRGEGATVWDADGKAYIDLLGGIAVNALGHAHPAVLEAVKTQLSTLGHVSNIFTSEPQVRLAERLLGIAGEPGRVFFTNSGAEANEAAFKATRKTGRSTIVATEGSFHGRTMGALALTSKAQYRAPFEPLPGDVRWVPYGDVDALDKAIDGEVAAFIVEPIQGEAGVIDAPPGYLEAARQITARSGTLLWLDEIQTGMGRTGAWLAYQESGIAPDLVTLAKGLGGGIPIGALMALGEAATLLGPGEHGTTFGGNPVATAAALAVIDTIEADGLMERSVAVGHQIRAELEAHPRVVATTGRGLLIGVVLDAPIAAELQRAALSAGVIVNAPTPDRIRMAPPLILSSDDASFAIGTLTALLDQLGDES
jgi:acetylornithine aminotransferase